MLDVRIAARPFPSRRFMGRRHNGMNSTSDKEIADHRHAPRPDGTYQVVEDAVRHGLVKMPLVPERPEVELQRLQFHAEPIWDIPDAEHGEIRLPRLRAETGEFRTLEAHLILPLGAWIRKGLQSLGSCRHVTSYQGLWIFYHR